MKLRIALAAAAVLGGLPFYLLLDELQALPPALRDRPWPFEALVLVSSSALGGFALSEKRRRQRWVAMALALLGAASLFALVFVARVSRHRLPDAPAELPIGHALPDSTLLDERGRPVALTSLRGGPSIVIFYRGGWCASCRAQLSAFVPVVGRFLKQGVKVVGVSPDPPDVAAGWSAELKLPFPLLSDQERRLAPKLCGSTAHCELLVDGQGVIRWGGLNDNWRVTARPEAVLQAAYRLR